MSDHREDPTSRLVEDAAALPARIENMRPGQVRDAVTRGATCLLPVGTIESEGDHVPLGMNHAYEEALAALASELGAVVAPPLWYAPTGYILSGPKEGTFDMPTDAFVRYVEEVMFTLMEVGFRRVEIVPLHNPQGEDGPLYKACKFVTANLSNDLWKDPAMGRNWWIRPDRNTLNGKRFGIRDLAQTPPAEGQAKPSKELDLPLRLEWMTPSQLKEAVRRGLPCFLPSGVLENHGNHNPIGCDAIEAQDPVLLAAGQAPAVVAPTIWYGPTGYAVSGPELATTNVDGHVYRKYMEGVLAGLEALGFKHIVIVQVHQGSAGPQWTAMDTAIQKQRCRLHLQYGPGWGNRLEPSQIQHASVEIITVPHGQYDHAGKNETSWMLHLRPEYTDMTLIRPGDYFFCWQPDREANKATAEWGHQMTERAVEGLITLIKEKTRTPVEAGQ